jgi:histidinol dehydrogenase
MQWYEVKTDQDFETMANTIRARSDAALSKPALREKQQATAKIVEAVRTRGDAALAEYSERFDGVTLTPDAFELTAEEIDAALAQADTDLVAALKRAHDNIRRFHEKHLRPSWQEESDDGTILGQRITPIESAGVYVPGGKAFYPSSVLMNIAPACVAGVKEIIMVSPPSWEGSIHPAVLAAAKIAGATRVFRVGGAQAVAALAYGTDTIPAVTKITGPGNTFVTAAKSLVRHVVDIDSEAGPSEVVVLADHTAHPRHVAYEMFAQAEHDEEAMSVLITPCAELAAAVRDCLASEQDTLSRKEIIRQSLDAEGLIIVTRDRNEAIALTNLYAPEHLSIQTESPQAVAEKIDHAGAIMLGSMTPVSVGDYYAGPNHILPTRRQARFASPLTAEDFRKVTSILSYSKERLEQDADDIVRLATAEGLEAHARAVQVRLEPKQT